MCGIFGIIQNSAILKEKLIRVSRIISHRGPDDEGFLFFNLNPGRYRCAVGKDSLPGINLPGIHEIPGAYNAAFLHRRLSIIDLTKTGHQPMSYDNGNLWLILNGEIYNYIELKEDLLKKGYSFESTSDSEVVLAAYKEWGEDCVDKFNGMWALAIWDRVNGTVFLSRDRFGIKPLYYYSKNGCFIFCSEIKGIRTYLSNRLTLSEEQINKYLLLGQIFVSESDDTFFEEVKQLMPGHNLILKENNIRIKKYWSLELKRNRFSFNENVERFKELFHRSLSLRLRSDVEVGSCLSGGIDSSSIVSFASKCFNKRFYTFSAVWPGEECDESFYINKVNREYNCISYAFEPDLSDILDIMDKEIWHQEIPLTGSSFIAQWSVMERVKKAGIKVVLDGQGADETLSGYPKYIITYINEMIRYFKWNEIRKHYRFLKEAGYNLRRILKVLKTKIQKSYSFSLPVLDSVRNNHDLNASNIPLMYNFLPGYLKDEIEKMILPTLLHIEDRNSMAHSVEARVPYLDYLLLEHSVNIPSGQKIFGALTKVILREAMKEVLPVEIYKRTDKIGFATPVEKKINSPGSQFHKIMCDYIQHSDLLKMDSIIIKNIQENFGDRANFALYSLAKYVDIWS